MAALRLPKSIIDETKTFTARINEEAILNNPTMVSSSKQSVEDTKPSAIRVWLTACRPHTLTASVAPVIVGTVLTFCYAGGSTPVHETNVPRSSLVSVPFSAFACLVQLGTNLHNDYADFVKGADDERRVGQARATQRGWLKPSQTAGAATLCLLLASLIGTWLVRVVSMYHYDWIAVTVMVSSVFNAVAYTGGPYPLGYIGLGSVSIGYSGLGDIFVFLYFGLVATIGVPYLYERLSTASCSTGCSHSKILESAAVRASFVAALPVGFLATAIIVVNNLRDRDTDVGAGKKTMAVRFGERFARAQYAVLVLGSYASLIVPARLYGILWMLPIISLPAAMPQLRAVAWGGNDGSALNVNVGGTARLQLLFCLLLSMGIYLSSKFSTP